MVSKLLFLLYQVVLRLRDFVQGQTNHQGDRRQFVVGINFAGPALTIEGDRWLSFKEALALGLSMPDIQLAHSYVRPSPETTYSITKMLNTVAFKAKTVTLHQPLGDGPYDLYLWVMENHQSDWHSLKVSTGDQVLAPAIGQLKLGNWAKYGPYRVTVSQGRLDLTLTSNSLADAHLMGMSIFAADRTS
ncbi:MAG: hypothetical protein VKL98_04820 [Cyanobacteriota bacterium]|nr:hypothetical protein [Cyanobacteriota bacterium]